MLSFDATAERNSVFGHPLLASLFDVTDKWIRLLGARVDDISMELAAPRAGQKILTYGKHGVVSHNGFQFPCS